MPVGVDVVDRPAGLPERVEWVRSPGGRHLPDLGSPTGALVLAHEWLDVVPCPVAEADDDGVLREVLVAPDGADRRLLPHHDEPKMVARIILEVDRLDQLRDLGVHDVVLRDAEPAAGRRPKAVVGRDPRASGEFLSAAVVAGLASAGVDVHDVGVVPTPAVAFLTADLDADLIVAAHAAWYAEHPQALADAVRRHATLLEIVDGDV